MINIPQHDESLACIRRFWLEVEKKLMRSYAQIGFKMRYFTVGIIAASQFRATFYFLCPCAGEEFAQLVLAGSMCDPANVESVVCEIMLNTASRSHIEMDVLNGTLPAEALDCNVYVPAQGMPRVSLLRWSRSL